MDLKAQGVKCSFMSSYLLYLTVIFGSNVTPQKDSSNMLSYWLSMFGMSIWSRKDIDYIATVTYDNTVRFFTYILGLVINIYGMPYFAQFGCYSSSK